ncbi:hypothetical protein Lal_00016212 [Lupinus albus]|nr:hypothetical protein Lal_00016212 [Lupinus albus]
MPMLRFWCCMILVLCSVLVSESRSLTSSFETKSVFPLGSGAALLVVSALKGIEHIQPKQPNRLSPMGPDPRHH